MKVAASYLFNGPSDYFGGHWCKDNEALLYAFYGHKTTLRDILDEWEEDGWNGSACEDIPENVTKRDIRNALLEMLTDEGRQDYDNNAIAECAGNMETPCCPDCGAFIGEEHGEDCDNAGEIVDELDCPDYESSVIIVVIEWEVK